jgi:membrane associated rhomboid family serine protease
MHILLDGLTEDEVHTYGLVLNASRIPYRIDRGDDGWFLSVEAPAAGRALQAIEAYQRENEETPLTEEVYPYGYTKALTGVWLSLGLAALHGAMVLGGNHTFYVNRYGSAAGLILEGEWYRTVTSLMIHANALHVAGNVLGMGLFATAACRIMGPGVGCFAILLSGIAGNFMNALLYQSGHLSVGSSTAVFGTVGILAGYRSVKQLRGEGSGKRAWMPLAGGVALLAFLGGSQYSDLTAHLFGFLAGIVLGGLYGAVMKRPAGRPGQACFLLLVLGIVVTAWIRGLAGGGQ